MANPIISAKLEFLATVITGVAASHVDGSMSDDDALTAVSDALEAFSSPISPSTNGHDTQPAAG